MEGEEVLGMFLLLLTVACSQVEDEEVWGVWEGDPQQADDLSNQLSVGEGSEIKVKIFERDGALMGYMRIEGELAFGPTTLDEGDATHGEAEDVVLDGDHVSADYSYLGLDFALWGCFEGDDDRVLHLNADQDSRKGRKLFFRGVPLHRTDIDFDTGERDTGIN